MGKRKQTLAQAIKVANQPGTELHRALNGLCGCPAGGWPETQQALRRIAEAAPHKSERTWIVDELVDAILILDFADRWWRN